MFQGQAGDVDGIGRVFLRGGNVTEVFLRDFYFDGLPVFSMFRGDEKTSGKKQSERRYEQTHHDHCVRSRYISA